ncbi:major facilitator superfamily protein [Ectothiorhodospira sp. PHS-1]|uniref:MFS transporter n=1 Tax=Ectothiorhodospira sp. PHS-1 TaxID=519989 RepID=UPI00024A8749|nr:MFS transporter [Ectothiorhodospira sp. PHS-1]EHQ51231.1 major facilitator superfamily protein [Ectothiorhodospira sp. PHS-1]
MHISHLLIVQYCAILVFSSLYAPQPLLPVLAEAFAVSEARASLLITVALLPLAIAPVAYGFLLQRLSARRLLIGATWLLAVTQVAVYLVTSFELLLALRLAQGLIIPAMLTSLMTYLAASAPPGQIARVMAIYIAASVLGGFLGRMISGLISTQFGWRWSFLFLAVAIALCALLLQRLKADPPVSFQRLDPRTILQVLRQPSFLRLYLVVFCAFGAFASLLNFLPFRLVELGTGLSETGIAFMYAGYLMGVVTSLLSLRIADHIGGAVNTMLLGSAVFLAALLFFTGSQVWVMFVGMFVLCAGMFLIHSLAPGVLNQAGGEQRGVVNGLYIAFYYAGGTTGSFLPGFLYHGLGWHAYLSALAVTLCFGGWLLWTLRRSGL